MSVKPSLPKGVRDFLPDQVLKRWYLFDTLRSVFQLFGFVPIETPSMEVLETLTGKYGEEGDRLLYKVLNNGDYLAKADKEAFQEGHSSRFTKSISKRGLRYDLTVPLARYVVMNQNDLHFPFKRYQIQPVWRADRAQRGRYNEFFQCDADVIGSDSLIYEAELLQMYDLAFSRLKIPVVIRYNHRKILQGLIQKLGLDPSNIELITTIDKLDKIGLDAVIDRVKELGFDDNQISLLTSYLEAESLSTVKTILSDTIAESGIEDLEKIMSFQKNYSAKNEILFDPKLARGLDYYTGCVIEVGDVAHSIGSLGGGGRYADLTSFFGKENMPGVGISFGAERIYLLMEERNLFPQELKSSIDVLITYESEMGQEVAIELLSVLRQNNIPSVIYPEVAKLKKQIKYGNQIKCRFVVVIGQKEIDEGTIILKNMESGDQVATTQSNLLELLKA